MATRRINDKNSNTSRQRPATTPQGRENQLIARAADLAERQLCDGTASAQVITHFLKLGSSREKLEQARIGYENELLQAKNEMIKSAAKQEEIYIAALAAMRGYTGQEPLEITDDLED